VPVHADHTHLGDLVRLIRSEDFAVDPRAAAIARRFIRLACHEIGEASDIAELLVSELVTNAIVHAETPCRVTFVALRDRPWWVEVRDWSVQLPQPRCASPEDSGGRGYELMETLAHWHTDADELTGCKVACFTLKGDTDDESGCAPHRVDASGL
jgi:anti-sigma regulatory factor (Ser/Thr protein kinase)